MCCSPPGSSVHGILQARILEWLAMGRRSRGSSRPSDLTCISSVSCIGKQVLYHCSCYCSVTSAMSNSVWPHRRQPTRLRCPWDSLGKKTGVCCHFLLQCMKVKVKSLSHVWLFVTPWTAVHQAPLSMGFSRQEYWSGVPLPSPSLPLARPNYFWAMLRWRPISSSQVAGGSDSCAW